MIPLAVILSSPALGFVFFSRSIVLLFTRFSLSRPLSLLSSTVGSSESRIETRVRLHEISHLLRLLYARLCTDVSLPHQRATLRGSRSRSRLPTLPARPSQATECPHSRRRYPGEPRARSAALGRARLARPRAVPENDGRYHSPSSRPSCAYRAPKTPPSSAPSSFLPGLPCAGNSPAPSRPRECTMPPLRYRSALAAPKIY